MVSTAGCRGELPVFRHVYVLSDTVSSVARVGLKYFYKQSEIIFSSPTCRSEVLLTGVAPNLLLMALKVLYWSQLLLDLALSDDLDP